jgi:succinylglutamate desuccinylase
VLTITTSLPSGFLDATPESLHKVLPEPTLIHLPGNRDDRLFVTILQHGNEAVGLLAVQALLKRFAGQALPRGLSVFVSNIEAARDGVRRLDNQPDYNRVWPGSDRDPTAEHQLMQQVVDEMRRHKLFASVDLHNNIGLNPHYACINRLDSRFLQLANLFSRTVVYFILPKGVQSMAMAELCPATTLECGKAGDQRGVEHAAEYLDACLHMEHLPDHAPSSRDIDLYHTVATVKVPEQFSLGGAHDDSDIRLVDDLEHLNFRELQVGTILATIAPGSGARFDVWHESGRDTTQEFLEVDENRIRLVKPIMPSMLTVNEAAIRQDCLCYFMERYPLPGSA